MSGSVVSTYDIEARRRAELEERIREEMERFKKEREKLLQVRQELQKEEQQLKKLESDSAFYGFSMDLNMKEYRAKLTAFCAACQQLSQLAKKGEEARRAAFYAEAEALKSSIPLQRIQEDYDRQQQKRRERNTSVTFEEQRQQAKDPSREAFERAAAVYENCRERLEEMRQKIQDAGDCAELNQAFGQLEEIRQTYSQRPRSLENEINNFWNLHAGDLRRAVKAAEEKEQKDEKYQVYLKRYVSYEAICEVCDEKPRLPPTREKFRASDSEELEDMITKMKEKALHRLSRKEVMDRIDHAMKRMGYSPLKPKQQIPGQFKAFYEINDGAAISVTHDESGQIIMNIGIPGDAGQRPTDTERKRAAKAGETFCKKREKMKAMLAEEGLMLQDEIVAPPMEAAMAFMDIEDDEKDVVSNIMETPVERRC